MLLRLVKKTEAGVKSRSSCAYDAAAAAATAANVAAGVAAAAAATTVNYYLSFVFITLSYFRVLIQIDAN